jgi:Tol biopolymer transport system component
MNSQQITMKSRFLTLVAVVFALFVGGTAAMSAPVGTIATYLPQIYRGPAPLPEGNLLLYTVGLQPEATIFLSPPPPATPIQLTTELGSTSPEFSPDGAYIHYRIALDDPYIRRYHVMAANGSANRVVLEVPRTGVVRSLYWASDSRTLAYLYNGGIRVQSIDSSTSTLIAPGASSSPLWDRTEMQLYYAKPTGQGEAEELRRIRADGTGDALVATTQGDITFYPQLAGGQLLFRVSNDTTHDLYRVNPDGSDLVQVTNTPEFEYSVSASPTGDRLFFQREEMVYLVDLTGTTLWSYRLLCPDGCRILRGSWSPDGTELSFSLQYQVAPSYDGYRLYQMTGDGSQTVPTTLYEGASASHGYSPDGRYFAYEVEMGNMRVLDRSTQTTTTIDLEGVGVYFYGWRPLP